MHLFHIACTVAVVSLVKGAIYSSQDSNVEIIDLNSERGNAIARLLNKANDQQNSGSRKKRFSTSPDQPRVSRTDLDKGSSSHNQAVVHWGRDYGSIVLILTRRLFNKKVTESTLWRSDNYGESFSVISHKFESDTVLEAYFACESVKGKLVFIDGANNSRRIWVTDNDGETYRQIAIPFSAKKIEFHPEECNWLLGHDKVTGELYCSMDFGETWQKLGTGITEDRFYWYVKDKDTGPNANKIVYFEQRGSDFVSGTNEVYQMKSCYVPDCTETPFQKHLNDLGNIDIDSSYVKDDYVFVQKSGSPTKLYVSYKRGPFHKATFPSYAGRSQLDFHIVTTDGECAVVGVSYHDGVSHLYFSDLEGKDFRQSLPNVRYFYKKEGEKRVYTVDIHQVQGLIGTYLANVFLETNGGTNTTRITHDNGKTWEKIVENVKDENGRQMASGCSGCHLNLHLAMTTTHLGYYMPAALSKKSVPGLILALGLYSLDLINRPNDVSLFVSNDNGKSWSLAIHNRHLSVIANHGTIIVAIEMIFLKPVNQFYFIKNYGETGEMLDFDEISQQVNIDGLLTVPGEASTNITILGHENYAGPWRIYTVDLSPTDQEQCNYPEDFRNITLPIEFGTPSCPFGYVQTIERLKEGKDCVIPATYEHTTSRYCIETLLERTLQDVFEKFFAT